MKTPLHYQISEYDCGPTSLDNALSFLFAREEIPPELLRNIMLYCLDCYGVGAVPGLSGTSRTAMLFLSHWLDGYGAVGGLPIRCRYLAEDAVTLEADGAVVDALHRGGVAVVRLWDDGEVEHYALLTGEKDGVADVFDPYYRAEPFPEAPDITVTLDEPFRFNRRIPLSYFNHETHDIYSLGEKKNREAILLFNADTMRTEETTIEYYI